MAQPPAVVMISAGFYPAVGGAERQALELSVELQARGARVFVLTRLLPPAPPCEKVRGVPVFRLRCWGGGALNSFTFLISLMGALIRRRGEYEAIHVHLAASPALAAVVAGRLLNKRVVIKLGGPRGIGELAESAKTFSGRMKLAFLSLARPQFVAITQALTLEAAQYLGPVPVVVVPNGVDTEHYKPVSPEEKRARRAVLGWPEGLGFLFAGRLWPQKNLPFFLEQWLAETDAKESAFVVFIGEGPEEPALRAMAAGRRVFFLEPRADIADLYAAADIFVLPSLAEGLSNAMLEAMASGLAVLGSRISGTVEVIEENLSGLLFELGNAQDLRRQLRALLNDPALAARLGQEARRAAMARYAMPAIAARYESLYSDIPL